MKYFFLGLILLMNLSACGYKGNLYLPDNQNNQNQKQQKQKFGVIQTGLEFNSQESQDSQNPQDSQ